MDKKIPVDNSQSKMIVMIVQALPPMQSGGAEIQALRIAAHLRKDGANVIFITPGEGKIKGGSVMDGVPVYRLHSVCNYIIDFLLSFKKKAGLQKTVIEFDDNKHGHNTITRKIGFGARLRYNVFLFNAYFFLKRRRQQIAILHSHTIEWPGYVAAVLSKWLDKKLLVKDSTMNGIFNILRFPSGEKKQALIIRRAHFVAMTRVIKDNFLRAGIDQNKITEIPNGINILEEHKINYTSKGKILFAGNLYQQPAKGIDLLLRSWKNLSEKKPELQLLIAGDGDLDAYRKYVQHLGIGQTVQLLGRRNDIGSLMLECDVFVLPSRREGMPNVLMEAMLRAVPCVATDISGSQDLITHGVNGLLVPVADTTALADSIDYLLTHRREAEEMGTSARQTILNGYSIADVARKYAQLYEEL